jgi:HEPN domain-containing protein
MSDSINNYEVAGEWLFRAKDDLESAEYLLGKKPLPIEIICFHCQQSAEKILKGLLILQEINPPKIHDLVILYDHCQQFTPEFDKILKQCERLNPYSVSPRYPNEKIITEQQMQIALTDAREVLEFF